MIKMLAITILICILFSNAYPLYEPTKSNVAELNPKYFDIQIIQARTKTGTSFVHFYKKDDLKSHNYKNEINKLASDYDGMFKIAAVNCGEYKELCDKQEVREFPSFKIYPPLPAPVFPYEGDINAKSIIASLGRFVDNKVTEIHSGNIDTFLQEKANIPKILLFTDKKGVPLIYKVIATQFDKKAIFGIIRNEETAIIQKYKIKAFPKFIALPVGAKKPDYYEGDTKFKSIFDFVNIYSETFFKVGEDKTKQTESTKEDKPWLNEKLPELNSKSGNDVCFKVDGVICVVFISNGKLNENLISLSTDLQNYLSPKIDYGGSKYKFSWINAETQKEFLNTIGASNYPNFALLNPGKRKRFFTLDQELSLNVIKGVFDKLASGDLRFKMFPGNNIPELNE